MKKILYKLPFMLLLITPISSINAQNRNYIEGLKILPVNPNSSDTIKVVCIRDSLYGLCKDMDTAKININNFNISVFVNYSNYKQPCYTADTLTIGPFSNTGNYNLQYKLINTLDSTFDIDSLNFNVQIAGTNENINTEPFVIIYPNPIFYSSTLFSKHLLLDTEFLLYNVFGQIIKKVEIKNSETEIMKDNLQRGVYFYKIQSKKIVLSVGKLIIQ